MKLDNGHNHKGGFKVPKNYFDQLEKKLEEKLASKNDFTSLLKQTKGGLKIPKKHVSSFENNRLSKQHISETKQPTFIEKGMTTGFSIPKNYFEAVEKTIVETATNKNKKTPLFSKRNIAYLTGIAAMIALIISISINDKESRPFNFENIALTDIQEYLDHENIDFNEIEISTLLDKDISYIETYDDSELSNDTLLDYLSDEEIENEIIQ